MSKEKLLRLAERALKRTEYYQNVRELDVPDSENYKIDYLLIKGGKSASEDVIAYASYEDEMLRFRPLEEKDKPCLLYTSFSRLRIRFATRCIWTEAQYVFCR